MEIWKDIKGYEGLYKISNYGRIKSMDRFVQTNGCSRIYPGKMRKWTDIIGYKYILLSKCNRQKNCKRSRLVAGAFIPNPVNKPEINHINGIKTDDRIENLEWCTRQENVDHAVRTGLQNSKGSKNPMARINEIDVIQIRIIGESKLLKRYEIAKLWNVSKQVITYILNKQTWLHV